MLNFDRQAAKALTHAGNPAIVYEKPENERMYYQVKISGKTLASRCTLATVYRILKEN